MSNKMINFSQENWIMPFLFTQGMIFLPILKEILKDEFSAIKSIYGCPQCLFSGGRPTLLKVKNLKNVEKTVLSVKEYNITPSFTLTNTNLTKEELKDEYSLGILKIISESNSNAIVSSDVLYNYIREKFPNIKLTASVIKSVSKTFCDIDEETQYINSLIYAYDKVVIRSEYLMKNKTLSGIKDASKLVILVNSTCKIDCPYSKRHYDLISKFHRHEISYQEGFEEFVQYCPKVNEKDMKENLLNYEMIETAIKAGVHNLKFQGRQLSFDELFKNMCHNNFFNKDVNIFELRNMVDEICAKRLQNSLDLQLYSIMKRV